MKESLLHKLQVFKSLPNKLSSNVSDKLTIFRGALEGLPLFASQSESKQAVFDEKHYFVIPFASSQYKVALHTIRSLPCGAPEINSLPKRRVFHFFNEHTESLLEHILLEQAEILVTQDNAGKVSRLEQLANDIDALDTKLTYGMMLVGSLSALVNPVVGAAITAKAILPSVTGLLNKHGLRPLAEKRTQKELEDQVKEAQDKIQQEFSEAQTVKFMNPVLQRLDLALRTDESQYDPLLDSDVSQLADWEKEAWQCLTIEALEHVYQEVIADPKQYPDACLGEEDIRWLNYLFEGNKAL
ncbi:hypothetical protein N474_01605 [Pseudoalteromonas luteoviolacea CPMOR-2]|uniref:Uncharacterized protein n=1 Tax=Pseudoalteromonas luteoviolacea DSM 6061 TaxID=1365250 RepID=A0A166WU18_9GAMM|nr:hypothetical protein [Pseudoalteromonas luteoviolacea]KZN38077.1 hypothetical protein N475_15730 [Pseudoalteromonas luteoviolacea DSM 6061]KZN54438.1 hypothetical protein N474_01605 [Pseudoalteromonas luteoviolacea CPMOR-2]MBE0388904.1 hypothetical protein [Pseudoalteromonas luteoviolacea DSM 6061]